MRKIDKIRRLGVVLFICSGIFTGFYEMATVLPEFKGKGQGFSGEVSVKVSMSGDEIKNIMVTSHGDTPEIAQMAIDNIIPEIIITQSIEVDDIGGATYTSRGIKEAVGNAIEKSKLL
ncbi:FMN-binding protein [Ilyobacter polytropus]|uniref:FMN-binding domain protein n=1 Tax=Ilyobacter polytropus (strain ATCC 51220 / DSM 2926 / LMG 16218 / CuHBu1) TaxID=572544 RepID=E3HDZ0_ILYPC|nr:FMN-binding protein [Ilyobacter polytropus]ADO84602.1 FMN-binding domain protein [Ilyobacter polytropus DSM 2926]